MEKEKVSVCHLGEERSTGSAMVCSVNETTPLWSTSTTVLVLGGGGGGGRAVQVERHTKVAHWLCSAHLIQ